MFGILLVAIIISICNAACLVNPTLKVRRKIGVLFFTLKHGGVAIFDQSR